MSEMQEFTVPKGASVRADRFLLERLAGLSRRHVRELFASGRVRVDGRCSNKGRHVAPGQLVEVRLPSLALIPNSEASLCIHIEEADFLVVEKPALMSTHPIHLEEQGTLVNALAASYPEIDGVGEFLEGGAVHRLDQGTSGLLIVARNQASYDDLRRQFKERRVVKEYLALVEGRLEGAGRIKDPITHHPKGARRMIIAHKGEGLEALTEYEPLRHLEVGTLLKVRIATGVRHQIRIHLASLGHPVRGDGLYGVKASWPRPFLHASHLAFRKPGGGPEVCAFSPLPPALARAVEGGGGDG